MKTSEIVLTNDELLEKAIQLSASANQIRLIERLIGLVEYSRVSGNNYMVQNQIDMGLLGDIKDSLSEVKEVIQNISTDICPD